MNFRNLIIFPKHLFEEWKTIVDNEQRLSTLDKKMKKIMNMKNLNDDQKWLFYKQQLIRASNILKPIKQKPEKTRSMPNKKIKSNATQTTDLPQPLEEEIFDSENIFDEEEEPLEEIDFNNENKLFFDDDLEHALHEEAQHQLEVKDPRDVVRRDDSLGKAIRVFENPNTGDRVDIEVEPIRQMLYNEDDDDGEINTKPVTIKKSRTKKIHPQVYKYDTRLQLRQALKPKELAQEQFLQKTGTRSTFNWEGLP